MGRMGRGVVLAAAIAWCAAASAGDIYVCKGPHGSKVYQNTACTTTASQLGHNTYSDAMSAPPAPAAYSSADVDQSDEVRHPSTDRASSYAPPPAAPAPPTAYQCVAGRRQWVQHTPCPTSYATAAPITVDGFTQYGTHISGTGVVNQQAPVQQTTLDHDAFCEQVRAGARLPGGGSSASQSYERNKIKRNECGG